MNYKKAGVNINAGYESVKLIKNSINKTHNKNVLTSIGGFAGLYNIKNLNIKNPILVSGTDGVGTKLKYAFMLNKHDTVGQDLVAMCVNDIICVGAKPLFFLDYIGIDKNKPNKIAEIVKGIAKSCQKIDCALIGGETAEMNNLYQKDEYDLAGFCVGVVGKDNMPKINSVKDGDVVIGIKSSGIHSNGFSLVRKIYNKNLSKPMLKKLLTPTKLYVNAILDLMKKVKVKSISNITGGGFYENIPRSIPKNVDVMIRKKSWVVPTIFKQIAKDGKVNKKEMFNVFNMGIGMTVIVSTKDAKKTIKILEKNKEKAFVIGSVINGTGKVVLT